MTSKLGIKPSKRERPKSSEKVAPARFARRPREAGTPENKVQSPVATACQIRETSDSASPIQAISEWEKEIKSLRINPENLKSTTTPPISKGDHQSTKVLVKKKVSSFEIPKEKKKIIVAQRAPSDAEVKVPNPEDFPGLRVDDSGRIVPYSILGPTEDFIEYAVKSGHQHNVPVNVGSKSTPSPWPEDDDPKRSTKALQETRQTRVDETRALENWERQINIRMNEQRFLSGATGMPPDMLLMNQDEDFRRKQEDRTLIDRAMPAVDYGKGYRVGSEFWKQVEELGGEEGIKMTLTQTERGYAPPFEYIGRPDTIRKSMGTNWKETRRMANIHYPWLKSQYLQERKQDLMNVIEDISSHRPYLDELEIVGQSLSNDKEQDNILVDKMDTSSELSEATHIEEMLTDPLADYEDVVPLPIFGPSLTINGYAAQWNSSGQESSNNGLNIRLSFQVDVGSKSYNTIDITNDGTAVIYYSWKKVPIKDPFGIKKVRPLQRFFFDLRNGVILPNSSINMPLTFISHNAGIFTETWQLDTQPELCGGSPIYVILRGIATEADKFADKRKELEEELQRRQVDTFIKEIVEEIFNGVRTPPRPSTPVDSYLTEEELFSRQNKKMNFNKEAVSDLKVFHTQLRPDDEWNMSIDTLLKEVQGTEDDDLKETLVQKLNEDVEMFANSLDGPVQKTPYNLCYQLLCEAMDNFYAKAGKLRLSMGLPEKEFAVEVLQEEVSKRPKKSQAQEAQKLASDKKQDPKKKDPRPTSSRGKTVGNSKNKVKEAASTLPMAKLGNADAAANKSNAIAKSKVEKREAKSPLEICFGNDLCLQLYDILSDVASRMEMSF